MQLQGKKALVMGLGVHGGGLGVARFLHAQGAEVTVTDLRDAAALESSLDALAGLPIHFVLGEHRDEDFTKAELVVKNPGVPAQSRFLQIARDHGTAVETEMTLFFRLCAGPILGITGTKGKTTTTMLAGAMLREQFPDTVVAGNMRVSALEQLGKIGPKTPVVLELSSFALEDLGQAGLSPRYACVTNLSPDHLDRYSTMEAYAEAKRQIFQHQNENGVLVLNANDPTSSQWADGARGRVVWTVEAKSEKRKSEKAQERKTTDNGQLTTDILWYGDHGLAWQSTYGEREKICSLESIRLPGAHNLANVAAAAALAKAFGVTNEHIRRALETFTGVEHRLEFVREVGGVRFVNDTAATVPEAAIAALRSFDGPIVLICGGADKRLAFAAFAQEIAKRAKAVVLLQGTATAKLEAALQATNDQRRMTNDNELVDRSLVVGRSSFVSNGPFTDFAAAIRAARDLAEPGDVVLLSPGCASFGMFKNEFHRGEEFRRIVKEF